MFCACTEDQPVEQPAIGLFAEFGWSTVSALEERFGLSHSHPPNRNLGITPETLASIEKQLKLR
ncbi:MAG: hypothetical protein WCO56_03565 [Verrucomicrobiota bacterium]